jgi:hypothetical protein
MRKFLIVALGVLALTTTGLAVAKGLKGAKSMKAVAGTFAATPTSDVKTKTCTTSDGKTIVASHGKYTGTATGATAGDADLTGPVTLDVHSVLNTTDDVGVVEGKLKIDVASGKDTALHYDAVYDHGKLAGFARGHAHDPGMQVLANLSADFTSAGGFVNGKLGGGTAGGSALELGPGKCAPEKPDHSKSPAHDTKQKEPKKHK